MKLVTFGIFDRALVHPILGDDAKVLQDVDRAVELGFDRCTLAGAMEISKQ